MTTPAVNLSATDHHVTIRGYEVPVSVFGSGGTPIVLLPGGAAGCTSYFPELVDALAIDHSVVVHDRLGTGSAPVPAEGASLRSWSADIITVLDALGLDRVLLVGQSLGGALIAQLLLDHPERVAGALLLDPTPVNDPDVCATTIKTLGVLRAVSRVPVLGSGLVNLLTRLTRPKGLSPAARAAYDATVAGDFVADTARAVQHLCDDAAAFAGRRRPSTGASVIVVTADRKPTSKIRLSHERLAELLEADLEVWPDTGHSMHLQRPDLVIDRTRRLLGQQQP